LAEWAVHVFSYKIFEDVDHLEVGPDQLPFRPLVLVGNCLIGYLVLSKYLQKLLLNINLCSCSKHNWHFGDLHEFE
jgi:hypothetical protein